jgi:2-haloalkanoic acid dehalogenase type II
MQTIWGDRPESIRGPGKALPETKIITFDCYGTLVQWREVLLREIDAVLAQKAGVSLQSTEVLATFSANSRRLEAEKPHHLYKDVLRVGFRSALDQHQLEPTDDDIERLAGAVKTMNPYPEVDRVLRGLRERYKLAIFTNSDEDLIVHNLQAIGVPFDYVITAERARAYKPSRHIFEYGYRAMSVTKDETVHVAAGMFLDMKACRDIGIRGIWINRFGEVGNPDWLPYSELPDLNDIPSLLLS